jgi:glutaredoxin 3
MTKVVMYTTGSCPYCVRAKNLLQKKGVTCQELRVDQDPALRPEMESRSGGRRTVPQIFIGDFHVGGFDDMVELDTDGKLDPLLGLK